MTISSLRPRDLTDSSDDATLSPMDRRIERHLITPRRIATVAGVAAFIALLAFSYLRYGLDRTLTVGGERVTVSQVSYGTFHEYIPVTGNVVPLTTVYLDAVEGGQVTDVFVEEGALVEAGERLVRLKNTGLQLEVIGAEAQLTEQLNYLASTRLAFEQNQ